MQLQDLGNLRNGIKNNKFCNICLEKSINYIKDLEAILLDVRLPSNVNGKTVQEADIPNAYYTPYTDFINYIEILPKNKNTPIIVASHKGWFATRVKEYLEMLGFKNIYILCDNIEDWIVKYLKLK